MSAIFFLIGCSVFIAVFFLGAFIWANKSGQNEDLSTPAFRILFENDIKAPTDQKDDQASAADPDTNQGEPEKSEEQNSDWR